MNKIKFLKQNKIPIIIILGIMIIGVGIFLFYNTSDSNEILVKEKCREDGEKYFQEDKAVIVREQSKPDIVKCYYFEPNYIFNKKLNTCLYSGGYTCDLTTIKENGIFEGEPATRWERHIIDVYTNKNLASAGVNNTNTIRDWETLLINDFWDESKKLGF